MMGVKGVTRLDHLVMTAMADGDEWTVLELRSVLGYSQQALRGELNRLCELGVVEFYRSTDPRERRTYRMIGKHPSLRRVSPG